jgi:hypothetical protein
MGSSICYWCTCRRSRRPVSERQLIGVKKGKTIRLMPLQSTNVKGVRADISRLRWGTIGRLTRPCGLLTY